MDSRLPWPAVGLAAAALLGGAAYRSQQRRDCLAPGRRAWGDRAYELGEAPGVASTGFAHLVESLTGAPVRDGNRVTVLRNGCRIFPSMLEAIKSADHTIDFATYIYWTGDIAQEFATSLAEQARRGIEVNILLDAVGAARMDRALIDRMEAAGARVEWFRPPRWHTLHKQNNRTHRKVLVVDGRIGFTGGVGIAEEWTGDCEDPDHWRDTHVRVEGPAVRDLLGGFQDNWTEATGRLLVGEHTPHLEALDGGVPVHITRSAATYGHSEAEQLYFASIAAARERLWLTTAYFAPRPAFVRALVHAAQRGVDVRVLVNGARGEKEVVRQAGHRTYERLLAGGVRLFEYRRTMLHAKVMTVDRTWSSVGSINLDNRSFALNDELNLSAIDDAVAAQLDEDFARDLDDAVEIELRRWRSRPLRARATEATSGLLRQQL